ncbi:MAG TPA: Gfo/Idh/MocA family oxidoreductase [Chloroflexota bacterium]|nr:Gfo/Idh/MocA family oxidoreductase [Chloroflexota bacterium]
MAKTYRLGVIGFAHMHVNELMRRFAELDNVQWVACADTIPKRPELVEARSTRGWNLKQARERIGIPRVYDDYREMLENEQFDLVIFCPENSRHGEVAEAIAAHGANLLTEKPMAASLSEALRMTRAAQANGVELFINWPSTWNSAIRKAKDLLDEGAIGNLWEVKWRGGSLGPLSHGSVHPGIDGTIVEISDVEKGATWWHHASTGGGALLDYCCYGACLARWYVGESAVAAFGLKANFNSQYGDADDNAVVTVRFPRALAVLEATWSCVDHGVPTGPILYGNRGTMVVESREGKPVVKLIQGKGAEPRYISGDVLPPGRETIAQEIIHHLETGAPVHPTLEANFNLEAEAILDAGIRSASSGKLELVQDSRWCIG